MLGQRFGQTGESSIQKGEILLSHIQAKMTPSCSACCTDSGTILGFENGVRMRKIEQVKVLVKMMMSACDMAID